MVAPVPPKPTPTVEPFQRPEVTVPRVELLETIRLVVEAMPDAVMFVVDAPRLMMRGRRLSEYRKL